jgi:glutamate--cysteine ligase
MPHDRFRYSAELLEDFKRRYLSVLFRYTGDGPRSYGFEYEFLPDRPMDPADVSRVQDRLKEAGFSAAGKTLVSEETGMHVDFEPGGQIEYCSPPLLPSEGGRFEQMMRLIEETNAFLRARTGIAYMAVDYLPGRAEAPLCLTSARYRSLHRRLSRVGSRGLEMMKATASIHLHVVISDFRNLLPLFDRLCELSVDERFQMSATRRDIWDRTDPSRCGRPPCCFADLQSPDELIHRLIDFALRAEVLGEEVPFHMAADSSFEAFLDHMTTIFTDVRFNLKGPTLELRTPDSQPVVQFRKKWEDFVSIMENTGKGGG